MTRKHLIQLIVGILISAAALYVVFKDVTLPDLAKSLRQVRYVYLVPCLAVFYFGVWLRGVRWRLLFKPRYDVPLSHATGGIFICFAFNSIFPARAGEFARAYLVGKQDKTGFSTAFGTVVVERLLDVMTLLPCLVAALAIAPIAPESQLDIEIFGKRIVFTGARFLELERGVIQLAIVLAIGIALVSVPRSRGWLLAVLHAMRFVPQRLRQAIERLVHKFAEGLGALHDPRRVAILLALSLVIWLTCAGAILVLARGFPFQETMTFSQALATMVIVCIFIMVPAAPGYWGFYEAGVIFSLAMMGIHPNDSLALSFALILHLTQWVPIVAIGLPWAWCSHVSLDAVRSAEREAE